MLFLLSALIFPPAVADDVYTAMFKNETGGHIGSVEIVNGRINVKLDSREGIPESCYFDGYGWHLHEDSAYPNNQTWGFGDDCNYADEHFDPTVACSDLSAHGACSCLIPDRDAAGIVYDCQYPIDPFTCEFGDFSNKFEGGYVGGEPYYGLGEFNYEDPFLHMPDLEGKSIVFHCGTTVERIFCGAFQKTTIEPMTERVQKPVSDPSSLIADFGFGHIIVNDFDTIVSDFDAATLAELDDYLPGGASCYENGFKWHIHDLWEHTQNAAVGSDLCGSTYTAGHYDPTAACGSASGNAECGTCDLGDGSEYDCDFLNDPYSCEVGDLGGKFGKIMVGEDATYTSEFLPGLHVMYGKSIVLHCGDSGDRAICAKLDMGAFYATEVEYQNDALTVVAATPETLAPIDCDTIPGGCNNGVDAAVSTFTWTGMLVGAGSGIMSYLF